MAYWTATLFAAHATLADQSLTPNQADKLARLIIVSTRENHSARSRDHWKNVERLSAEFLTAEQQELLKGTEQVKSSRFYSQLTDAISEALESDRLAGIPPPSPNP